MRSLQVPELLTPSYSTNYHINDNHTSPIRSIVHTNLSVDASSSEALNEMLNLGGMGSIMKIMTLDSFGVVQVWTIKEVVGETKEDSDPGLMLGAVFYLVKTGTIQVLPYVQKTMEIINPEVCLFTLFPNSTHQILVAINDGSLTKTALVGSPGNIEIVLSNKILDN